MTTRAERHAARFWAAADMTAGPAACWPFRLVSHDSGYGRARYDGRSYYAHRLSWILTNGPIPAGLFVCHTCDHPPCVNPAHLWLGTNADNLHDMWRKGRGTAVAALNERQIQIARTGLFRPADLAAAWGVSARTIYRARKPDYALWVRRPQVREEAA